MHVFRTEADSPYSTEIVGAGICGPKGKGGVVVERAALVMQELQDDDGQPLEGKALESAAKEFAKDRGLRVLTISEEDAEHLGQELGFPPDRPPAIDIATGKTEVKVAPVEVPETVVPPENPQPEKDSKKEGSK